MITRFKLFENEEAEKDETDLVEMFSQKYIENYYDRNFSVDVAELSYAINYIDFVDENEVKDSLIKDKVNTSDIERDFSKNDIVKYINENLGLFITKLNKYKNKYNLVNLINVSEFDRYKILNKIDRDDIIDIIRDDSEQFIENYYDEEWEDFTLEQILIIVYGKNELNYKIHDYLINFIDEKEIREHFLSLTDFSDKFDMVRDNIPYDIELQKKLIEIDPNNVKILFDVMVIEDTIGTNYEFQKLYIDIVCKNMDDKNISETIKEINDRFILNPKIAKEYKDYTYLIDSEKYNL